MNTTNTPFENKNFIVAVTGGIAAYKTCTLVSQLAQAGASINVLMTNAATKFVTPLTFESLSGKPVLTSTWDQIEHHDSQHIQLARAADAFIIAPCTANTLAKISHGLADNIVTTIALALQPHTLKFIAPSMNADMYTNPVTQENLQRVQTLLGFERLGPAEGWQACRTKGPGRMLEPEQILEALSNRLSKST